MLKPRFQKSPDVEKCCQFLRENRFGGLISYRSIGEHLGRNIIGRDRYVLVAARRRLEKERIVFVPVTGRGVVLADDKQVAALSTTAPIAKTRRLVKVAQRRQKYVNTQNLGDERGPFVARCSVLELIRLTARRAVVNKMEEAVNSADGPLSVGRTVEVFSAVEVRGKKKTA